MRVVGTMNGGTHAFDWLEIRPHNDSRRRLVGLITAVLAFRTTIMNWTVGAWEVLVGVLAGQGRAKTGFLALPPVLDLKDRSLADIRLVRRSDDELLRELLIQLPRWRPGERDDEGEYQDALTCFLKRRLPGVQIETSVQLTPDSSSGRANCLRSIDLVLDRRIGIELKCNLHRSSELHRCVGQMQDYASLWGDRGPLFLLVCESERDFLRTAKAEALTAAQHAGAPFRVLVGGYRRG